MTLNGTERSIAVILAALEAAVAAGDSEGLATGRGDGASAAHGSGGAGDPGAPGARACRAPRRRPRADCSPVKTLTLDGELSAGTPTSDGVVVPVWFGTNRKPNLDQSGLHRQSVRSHHLRTGRRVGTESASLRRERVVVLEATAAADLRDDQLRVTHVEPQSKSDAFAAIRATVDAARTDTPEPQALVFIHGFRNSFEEAAIRAAQISYDLKVPGPTAFFNWPSRGTVHAYTVDEATIEASEDAITEFLLDFPRRTAGRNTCTSSPTAWAIAGSCARCSGLRPTLRHAVA